MLATAWLAAILISAPPTVVSDSLFEQETGVVFLSDYEGWTYMPGDNPAYADPDFDDSNWALVSPAQIRLDSDAPDSVAWTGIGWFRFRFTIDSTLASTPLLWRVGSWGGLTLFIDGVEQGSWGRPHADPDSIIHDYPFNQLPRVPVTRLESNRTYTMAIRYANIQEPNVHRWLNDPTNIDPLVRLAKPSYAQFLLDSSRSSLFMNMTWIASLALLSMVFFYFWLLNRHDKLIGFTFMFTVLLFAAQISSSLPDIFTVDFYVYTLSLILFDLFIGFAIPMMVIIMNLVIGKRPPRIAYWMGFIWMFFIYLIYSTEYGLISLIAYVLLAGALVVWRVVNEWSLMKQEGWVILISILLVVGAMVQNVMAAYIPGMLTNTFTEFLNFSLVYLSIPIGMLIHITLGYTRLSRERNQKLEKEVAEATAQLRSTMAQLVQQEKLASLGQLTAGIAHEIKNPLNFVNNFASVSRELVEELKQDVDGFQSSVVSEDSPQKTDKQTLKTRIDETFQDLESNLQKIYEHGSRADKIVKSMLMHSRGGSGKMEPTDVNALVQEYANLAFHGMRAGKNPITVDIRNEFDPAVGMHPMVAEDFSRVILNLCNNAFDAMRDGATRDVQGATSENSTVNRQPSTLILRTKRTPGAVVIEVEDNGPGIPEEIKSRILEPFFTTKKGTEGTGLGLSISNDILLAHGGSMSIDSVPGKTTFILTLTC